MAFSIPGDLSGHLSHRKNLRTAKMKLHSLLKKLYLPGWQSKTLNLTACEAPPIPSVKPEFHILHVWPCTHTLHTEVMRCLEKAAWSLLWLSGFILNVRSRKADLPFYSSNCNRASVALSKSPLVYLPNSLGTDYFIHQGDRPALTFSRSSTIAAPHWPFSDTFAWPLEPPPACFAPFPAFQHMLLLQKALGIALLWHFNQTPTNCIPNSVVPSWIFKPVCRALL